MSVGLGDGERCQHDNPDMRAYHLENLSHDAVHGYIPFCSAAELSVGETSEREIIERTLRSHGWNRQETAAALMINRTTLFNKMRKYDLLGKRQPEESSR